MEGRKEAETGEIEHLSLQMNGYSRDLLQRFTEGNQNPKKEISEPPQEIELNLGLSLGGCFGADPKENNRLIRSSSIAGLTTILKDDVFFAPQPVACPSLIRTCSLPTETEEEWRKRKELQSLRRLEAKRKRSEKQRNFRMGKDRASFEGNCEVDKPAEEEGSMGMNVKVKVESGTGLTGYPVGVPPAMAKQQQQFMGANGSWTALIRRAVNESMDGSLNGKNNVLGLRGFPPPSPPGSQGSFGVSEFETRPVQGLNNCTEVRSPSSVQSLPEQREQKPTIATEKSGTVTRVEAENPSKKPKVTNDGVRDTGMKVMDEMPCVSTKGDGPNGRRIEGFLYKYRKGEEVRIVCVCHGSFLTPAEFVKHAGGGDVAHPLRHIVVNPSSPFS
ncbi:Ninja [Macleaya cordata]|uniref:Ninja-family protein n=1 Tax=Macleaya cordata TaxID=56857 RepID=A0A200QVW0_MACCD|nr:Ninja [Macleaya cordata]